MLAPIPHRPAPPPRPPSGSLAPLPTAETLDRLARTETQRACLVPRVEYSGDLTATLCRPESGYTLRPLQSAALKAIRHTQGGFFPIGVGHGKTFIALLAGTVLGARHTLVLTKPAVVGQMRRDWETARRVFVTRGAVDIQSYEWISNPKNSSELDELVGRVGAENLVLVCDEAHALKNPKSARTIRVRRMLEAHPAVRFVALSGTVTSKSIRDFAHIAGWALRHCSFVPRTVGASTRHVDAWAECLDARGRPAGDDWNTIAPLLETFGSGQDAHLVGDARKSAARAAFQRRLRSSPGVIASEEGSLGTSLVIHTLDVEVPRSIAAMINKVYGPSEDPEGEILPDDASRARVGRHLSLGFYQKWRWPGGVVDVEWLRARRGWATVVREILAEHAAPGFDSEALVRGRIGTEIREGKDGPEHRALRRWAEVRHRPVPPSVPEWVDTFLLADVIDQLNRHGEPTIVWYQSTALEAAFRRAGIPVFGHGSEIDASKAEVIAASILVHGTGRNLQAWRRNLVVEPPSSGETWEQLIGRTHRAGQDADEVVVETYEHTVTFQKALASARESARYIQESTGNVQKLLIASWGEGPVK